MDEWKQWVRARLGRLDLPREQSEEISEELAGYLQDRVEQLESEGLDPAELLAAAEAEVGDWPGLARTISRCMRGEEIMKDRFWRLWLPGTAMSILAFASAGMVEAVFDDPTYVQLSPDSYLLFSIPWLITLIPLAAGATYWSLRAGGNPWNRILTALFPVAVLLVLFLTLFGVSFILEPSVALAVKLRALPNTVVSWLVLPGVALTLGALPFLLRGISGRRPTAPVDA